MCELFLTGRGRAAADDLLSNFLRIPVAKSLRIDTPATFDRAVARLAAELRARAHEPEEKALRAALGSLDVDWENLPVQARAAVVQKAAQGAAQKLKPATVGAAALVAAAALTTAKATRTAARQGGFDIGVSLSAFDRKVVDGVAHHHALFIHDATGRRVETFQQRARAVVAESLGSVTK